LKLKGLTEVVLKQIVGLKYHSVNKLKWTDMHHNGTYLLYAT